jgi:RimJ/RimL family protein N-acetyltransferase
MTQRKISIGMNHRYVNALVISSSDEKTINSFLQNIADDIAPLIHIGGYYDDALYICDDESRCRSLTAQGYAVCGLIHAHNRDCQFDGIGYIIEDPSEISLTDYEHIYRRLTGIPADILETERFILRETSLDDLDRMFEIYDDDDVRRFIEPLMSKEEEEEYFRNYIDRIYAFYNIGFWSVIRKSDGLMVGRAGIEYTDEDGVAELGFIIDGHCRRQGYAYEITSAIIDYARDIEDIDTVIARIREDNTASQDLCRKLGMSPGRELNDSLIRWSIDVGS